MAVRRASYKSPFLFMISSALSWVTRVVGRTMRHTEAAMGDLLQRVSEEFRTLFPPRTLRCFFELEGWVQVEAFSALISLSLLST
jgi:hypothetical protein